MINGAGDRWAHFITSWKGALATLFAAAAIGAAGALWLSGLSRLPERTEVLEGRMDSVESHNTVQDTVDAQQKRQSVWIICTSIPPNRLDVLIALGVTCPNRRGPTGTVDIDAPEFFQ